MKYEVPITAVEGKQAVHFWVAGRLEVLIFKQDNVFHAVGSICPHMGAQLFYDSERRLISCPWHGLDFNSTTGACEHAKYKKLRQFSVTIDGDKLVLEEKVS